MGIRIWGLERTIIDWIWDFFRKRGGRSGGIQKKQRGKEKAENGNGISVDFGHTWGSVLGILHLL